jgi:DNA-binding NarL/FixJ family response regulator
VISIVVADDHPVVRKGLRAALESEPDLVVVGEAANGLDAVALVERLRPDILIIDVMMPQLCGLEATRQVRQRVPTTRTILLTLYDLEAYVLEALRSGAWGYVLKGATMEEVVAAVRQVAEGRRYLSPAVSEYAIEAYVERAKAGPRDAHETLTSREREVLQLAAEGCSNSDIAARLAVSARTVESHRASLARKLGLRTQTDLIRYALRRGLITLQG